VESKYETFETCEASLMQGKTIVGFELDVTTTMAKEDTNYP
jgi:hypothetical protein